MASYARTILFRERYIAATRAVGKRLLALDWCRGAPTQSTYTVRHMREGMLVPLNDDYTIGFIAHRAGEGETPVAILNSRSAFVQWLVSITSAASDEGGIVSNEQVRTVTMLLDTPLGIHGYRHEALETHLDLWRKADLPPELRPPAAPITEMAFIPAQTREVIAARGGSRLGREARRGGRGAG